MTPKSPATQDTEHLCAKIWKLLDELEEVRSADPGEGDWRKLNAADNDLRKTLEAYEDKTGGSKMKHTPGPWTQGFTASGKECVWLDGHDSQRCTDIIARDKADALAQKEDKL